MPLIAVHSRRGGNPDTHKKPSFARHISFDGSPPHAGMSGQETVTRVTAMGRAAIALPGVCDGEKGAARRVAPPLSPNACQSNRRMRRMPHGFNGLLLRDEHASPTNGSNRNLEGFDFKAVFCRFFGSKMRVPAPRLSGARGNEAPGIPIAPGRFASLGQAGNATVRGRHFPENPENFSF